MTKRGSSATRPAVLGVLRRGTFAVTVALSVWFTAMEASALDEVPGPPAVEILTSPSGTYRLILRAPEDWQQDSSQGELFRLEDPAPVRLWQRGLPQEVRARFALVSDRGQVILLDDWWNLRSGRAVMLLGRDGAEQAVWGFDDVVAALEIEIGGVVAEAKHGPWIAAPPRFDDGGLSVLVPAGGKTLVIDPETGALSARP